jgi:hypothetical protein
VDEAFWPRDEKTQAKLDNLQQQVLKLSRKLKLQVNNGESQQVINETSALLDTQPRKQPEIDDTWRKLLTSKK